MDGGEEYRGRVTPGCGPASSPAAAANSRGGEGRRPGGSQIGWLAGTEVQQSAPGSDWDQLLPAGIGD